jgi:manganese/zinc/iron transport system permease protein
VGAFEPVGAILVVAMMAVPPATAYLLTDDLKTMLFLSVGCGVLSAVGGYWVAVWLDVSTAGAMSVVTGILFALALLLSPRHGVISRMVARRTTHTIPKSDTENVSPAINI